MTNTRSLLLRDATYLDPTFRLARADILIDGNRIGQVLPAGTAKTEGPVRDCSSRIVIPGVVNAHYHTQSTLARGLAMDRQPEQATRFERFQEQLADFLDESASREEFITVCKKGLVALVRQGVTCTQDSGFGEQSATWYQAALTDLGMRGLVDAYGAVDTTPAEEGSLVRFSGHLPEEEDASEEALADAHRLMAPGRPMVSHSLETKERVALIKEAHQISPIQLLDKHGLLSETTLLFHLVHASDEDLAICAKRDVAMAWCPVSNLSAGTGIAPIDKVLAAGLRVGLGTDWGNTNYWEVARLACGLLRISADAAAWPPVQTAWNMATAGGARAIGEGDRAGAISEGYRADLVLLDRDVLDLAPLVQDDKVSTFAENLLMAISEAAVREVLIDGHWVLVDGELQTDDEAAIETHYRAIVSRLF